MEARKPELITHVLARSGPAGGRVARDPKHKEAGSGGGAPGRFVPEFFLAPCGSVFLPSEVVAAAALPGAATAALDAYDLPPHLTPAGLMLSVVTRKWPI